MIIEGLFNILFSLTGGLIGLLPNFSISLDNSFLQVFVEIMCFISYFLPMKTIVGITTIIVSLHMYKVVISFIKTLWQIIPIL